MSLAPGDKLGPYEIRAPLGAGAMGEVYRAHDPRLGRDVALKVLPADFASDPTRLARFSQEARAASALNHPNIITIYEIGDTETSPFMAMELIEGRTLRSMINGAPLTLRTALQIATQLADGLSKAHEAGIVHRDLKPDNVMVTKDGFVKILDFGIAKLVGGPQDGDAGPFNLMTQTGFVVGTTNYMSPEQASGKTLDGRSDQFTLGLILYEMLAGRKAFDRPTVVQTLSAIIQEDAEPIERVNPRVPAPLRWILARLLMKDPEERYAATRDLARDLKQVRDNLATAQEGTQTRTAATPLPAATSGRHDSGGAPPRGAHDGDAPPGPRGAEARAGVPRPPRPRRRLLRRRSGGRLVVPRQDGRSRGEGLERRAPPRGFHGRLHAARLTGRTDRRLRHAAGRRVAGGAPPAGLGRLDGPDAPEGARVDLQALLGPRRIADLLRPGHRHSPRRLQRAGHRRGGAARSPGRLRARGASRRESPRREARFGAQLPAPPVPSRLGKGGRGRPPDRGGSGRAQLSRVQGRQ